ncbi:hypothetical protein [Pallidibacillus pasinlerensis]|uniref:Uncharacterized protein n=1 Tax=Pallidibacillus pasinlerensis TaxID=2703818 RepID=A0ABX0A588_9BACI|nr:hypothetical protein [Pallidibacillus pasinlerensis]NCU18603.1 hypothetical protein [Pallidibacillus pasinlerensis]
MVGKFKTWLQKAIRVLSAMIAVSVFFYILVFLFGFVPYGYNILEENGDQLTVKSYTVIGTTDKIYEYTPGAEDLWTSEDIKRIIKNEKWYYVLLFTAVTISTYFFVKMKREGQSFFRALMNSYLFFSLLIPVILLRNHLIALDIIFGNIK